MASSSHPMKSLVQLGQLGLLAAVFVAFLKQGSAQDLTSPTSPVANIANTNPAPVTDKKAVPGPFHGKLMAIDKVAKTISVGKRTFHITSETKMKKAGRPATLQDAIVGEPASGYVKPTPDGKWIAASVNFGPKVPENGLPQKKKPAK